MDNLIDRSPTREVGLFLVLAILVNGLILPASWSHTGLTGTFYLAFFVHAAFTLYDGHFNALRTKTWLLLLTSWILAEISPFIGYSIFFGGLDHWVATALSNLETSGWYNVVVALIFLLRALSLWPVVLLAILCTDVVVMHRHGWHWPPTWRTVIFVACAGLGGLASGLVPGALVPVHAPVASNDPFQVPPMVVPQWFTLTYYTALRALPDKTAGLVAMFAAMLAPAVWPWMHVDVLRTGPLRSPWALLCILFAVAWIGLAYLGTVSAAPGAIYAARVLLAYCPSSGILRQSSV